MQINILGIETSCDETAVAIYNSEQGLLSHNLYSQIKLHAKYGGVVPELASRDHVRKIVPLIEKTITDAGLDKSKLSAIAHTAGPGLVGALMVGAAVAQGLSYALKIPAIEVNHMEGHLLAPMLEQEQPNYPFIALLVSGGHTQLVQVEAFASYKILGTTLDDAVGEAFDKTAKLLGLPYPGGPHLAELAKLGQNNIYKFPRPMTDRAGFDFSFSGLKTFVANTWHASSKTEQDKANIAKAFQEAVVDTLIIKCKRALEATKLKQLVVAGGVSANTALRNKLSAIAKTLGCQVFYPRHEFCTDNGAMIAYVGHLLFKQNKFANKEINVRSRWSLAP